MRGSISLVFAILQMAVLMAKEPPEPGLLRPVLEAVGANSNGWFRLAVQQPQPMVYTVERSADLQHWSPISVLHGREDAGAALPFTDLAAGAQPAFYRVHAGPVEFENDWRNHVYLENDEFRSEQVNFALPETRWIKFAIVTNEPARVYFQNSWKYKFHYQFATARLPQFKGMTAAQFDAVTLRTNAQQAVLGAVLFAPMPGAREAAIQFVGQDAYAPEQIAAWFHAVRESIVPNGGARITYMPAFEQAAAAEQARDFLSAHGIQVSSLAEWDTGESCYSPGWAIGRLKFVTASQIDQAYATGELTADDILMTDGIPAEIPFVRGIVSLAPSTPNSHVALLARSYQVPFAYFSDPEARAQAQALVGREVIYSAYQGFPTAELRLLEAGPIDPAVRADIAAMKEQPPLNIVPKERFGAYTASADGLTPADIRHFGGKAANFGFVRRQAPSNSPPALAISFDLWDDFMDQTMPGGVSLRTVISNRLGKFTYPPNVGALRAELEAIRELIEDETLFTSAQQDQIAAALLAKFDPNIKIRFRSSTNVEDTEQFVGAGLYTSYSGCLADDRDSDAAGPSHCDSAESRERGVFRAIRRVYASFYNENAVLERMRHRVDESKAGMAILVHYSDPDETEMANGVATVTFQKQPTYHSYVARMVTQKGAVSVTNPDGTAQPEVVQISYHGFTPFVEVRQWSSLVPFGATVLERGTEYTNFASMFSKIAKAFEAYYPGKTNYTLDFEYKKLVPGVLVVRQVRQLPTGDPNATNTTFLLNVPVELEVFQGEFGDVIANHRLKARMRLESVDAKLTASNLNQPLIDHASIVHVLAGATNTIAGAPAAFEGARHQRGEPDPWGVPVSDSWLIGADRVALSATLRDSATPDQSPFVTLKDGRLTWSAEYSAPKPTLWFDQSMTTTTNEVVLLRPVQATNSRSILVTRTTPASKGASIMTQFFWPDPPAGNVAGYTAPLQQWVGTRIEGLTAEPIELRSYWSQTYRPEHHNFGEYFLFEPALEPGLSPAILAELESKNIRYIHVHSDSFDPENNTVRVAGPDWQFRPLVAKP
jgi:hypothetical protein